MIAKSARTTRPTVDRGDTMLIWGINPVNEFLTHEPAACVELYVIPSFGRKKRQRLIFAAAERGRVPVRQAENLNMPGIPDGAVHQGVVARVRPIWEIDIEKLPMLWTGDIPLVIICDEIKDPGNLGAIIRSAAAFGVHAVILSRRNSAEVNGTVVKASAGAVIHTRLCRIGNTVRAMEIIKKMGLWVAALAADGNRYLWEQDMKLPLALVLGAEGTGIRPLVMKHCDLSVSIPQATGIESLNVASACTAALYEAVRQRLRA